MRHNSKIKSSFLMLTPGLTIIILLQGCGGGGGGSSAPSVPTPFDATYNTTYLPLATIPRDGKAPTGSVNVVNGRVSLQTTFYLQPSVVASVQKAIDKGLNDAGFGGEIRNNQVPTTIDFTGTGQLDGSGKVVLRSRKKVDICGNSTLTINPTFTANGTNSSGEATYQIDFPNNLTIDVRGERTVSGTCNNLPLRSGTVTFTRANN